MSPLLCVCLLLESDIACSAHLLCEGKVLGTIGHKGPGLRGSQSRGKIKLSQDGQKSQHRTAAWIVSYERIRQIPNFPGGISGLGWSVKAGTSVKGRENNVKDYDAGM